VLIAPIIFCTVVNGIAHMADVTRVGRVAIKTLVYFEVLTTVALVIGLFAVNVLKPGAGMNVDLSTVNASVLDPYIKQSAAVGLVPFLMGIIPNTFVGAFAEGNVLQVLFISLLCGFALVALGAAGKPFLDVLDAASKMIFTVVAIVMWAAPLGAFGAIAFTVGKFGVGSLASLGRLLADFYLTCVVFIAVALGPVAALCGFNLWKLIRYLREEILVCIATTSSETVLPRLIDKMKAAGCEESVVGLVVPTGYSSISTAPVFISRRPPYSWRRRPTRRSILGSRSACSSSCSSPRRVRPVSRVPPSSSSLRRCRRIRRFRLRASRSSSAFTV
jgi:aerobic C4-dicarboxylate transport protein